MKHFAVVLTSVVEAEILHVVEFDGLQLLPVQYPVAEWHPADELPAGHHPHHRVVAADLQVSCKRGCSRHSCSRGGAEGGRAAWTYWDPWRHKGPWWAATSTYRSHFLRVAAQSLLFLHTLVWISVEIKTLGNNSITNLQPRHSLNITQYCKLLKQSSFALALKPVANIVFDGYAELHGGIPVWKQHSQKSLRLRNTTELQGTPDVEPPDTSALFCFF